MRLYVTHLTTDKPMYQPGETIYFRSLTLERFSLKPPRVDLHLIYELRRPNQGPEILAQGRAEVLEDGNRVAWPDGTPVKGIGGGSYTLSPGAPGGEYTLAVREADDRFEPQERKFLVNRYQPPQLNKELEFTKKSYGPGEEVVAACKVSRVADASVKVANQPVEAAVNIDGKTLPPLHLRTDALGAVNVRFRLPAVIARGEGTLAVTFVDRGGSPETIYWPIPICISRSSRWSSFPRVAIWWLGFPTACISKPEARWISPRSCWATSWTTMAPRSSPELRRSTTPPTQARTRAWAASASRPRRVVVMS